MTAFSLVAALLSGLLIAAVPAMGASASPTGDQTTSADESAESNDVSDLTTSELQTTDDEETPSEEKESAEETPSSDDENSDDEGASDEAPVEDDAGEESSEDEGSGDSASTESDSSESDRSTDNSRDGPADEDEGDGAAKSNGASLQAASTPVYEITGRWIEPPQTIARGNPVVAEWRVNVNDDEEPPSNDPVDNVVATFTVDKAFFDEIPDLCLTDGVDPVSSISDDGTELTCNFGTVKMGTAIVVQTPVVANGVTGEEIVLDGTSPGGETVELPPILIRNPFVMDIHYGGNSQIARWDDEENPGDDPRYVDVDIQWSLRMGKGSDPGPDEVTYRLNVGAEGVAPANIRIGTHPNGYGVDGGVQGCTRMDGGNADGHPWSSVPEHFRHTNFVDECILTRVSPGVFELTLRGINYDLLNVPTHDSNRGGGGNPLPVNWDYVASGSLWFRVFTSEAGSITVQSNAPTYQAPTGQTYTDLAGNNRTNKSYTRPGGWSSAWVRSYTNSGGTSWDDSYRVSAGTTVMAHASSQWSNDDVAGNSQYGNCLAFDTAYVTYQGDLSDPEHPQWFSQVRGYDRAGGDRPAPLDNPPPIEYYTGGVGNPDTFDCGTGAWSTTPPANMADVTAIRIRYPHSLYGDEGRDGIQLLAYVRINDDVPVGQDVWSFGSTLRNGTWIGPGNTGVITRTPGTRYPQTNGRRDILRIVTATPAIQKLAERTTVSPGVPTGFTLRYSANGSGIIPETVDDYEIVDTLPLGMTYEPGSADPEPVVTTDPQGRQVLTWTLDGVTTNEWHELTYQAVADSSIEPGTQLTNTAYSSYGGENSPQVSQTVTITRNGHTIILKTADVDYIPNREGDGVGTGSWTVRIESTDPTTQAFTDTIDILPYNGDQRGTSFSGTYTLDDVVTPDGGTVYYTDADPATLTDDPADESNGAAGDPTGNTVGWTTERPETPTAIRVIGGELESGESFSFQVVITTDGAEPQDVYVNRAQARAEHTELVMRTSAPLIVTDYMVEKSSDPESGSTVKPGDVINYTVTVTQEGDVPAGAVFRDTMAGVFDDAVYNDDLDADIGEATLEDGVIYWEGDVPVGEVATITYSVTVKDVADLAEGEGEEGFAFLENDVWSPGCPDPDEEDQCRTVHPVGYYEYSKTSDPAPDSTVQVGEVVTYTVEITQKGEGAVEDAIVTDDLTEVLDDAEWNSDAEASQGEVTFDEPNLTWTGDLDVGDVVTLTYSVTVGKDGDFELANIVTSPDEERSRCVPAPDENPDCMTKHFLGDFEVTKVSDPESGSEVEPGDIVEYTVTVRHIGKAPVEAEFEDDMTQVLDDATYNDDVEATSGEASFDEPVLSWSGPLDVDEEATVTYSVTVNAEGDRFLKNVVMTPNPEQCVPAEGQDEACTTEHINGAYTFSKTSDPEPGALVEAGEVVTYSVLIEHVGTAPVEGASIEDDLSDVLDDAEWNDDAKASSGEVSFEGTTLTWNGDLEVDQVVELTYSVTVGDEMGASLLNVVTTDDERGVCVPAPDENPDCTTSHFNAAYVFSKTSDPESGSQVKEGDKVTYTLTIEQVGDVPVEDARVMDDLSEVSNVASWNDDAKASSGKVSRDGTTLTWTGDLEVDEVVTVTYSVTVGDEPDATMKNVVTSDDERAVCVEAADGNADCKTEHHTPSAELPGPQPPGPQPPAPQPPGAQPPLADTGSTVPMWVLVAGVVLLVGGMALASATRRRRERGTAEDSVGIDDLF
ncbi:DUF7927 domain-containing protein [Phytoactinopolyspora halotolerans]|uniref:DUF11 domain-containing protein n=1 Tax=Phytoactinopolyspora halotolerans TaxID=1981512 RepID=A0A6L9SD36_9ACTN|nr:DUF11 domain-containing protein [Phytoactinopolyspora halotolerans]NEE03275.1 DUF11 domain-containing protein [Phytoactinopolyspora halotolerans]